MSKDELLEYQDYQIEDLNAQIDGLDTKVDNLNYEIKSLESSVDDFKNQVVRLNELNSELKNALDHQTAQLENIKSLFRDKLKGNKIYQDYQDAVDTMSDDDLEMLLDKVVLGYSGGALSLSAVKTYASSAGHVAKNIFENNTFSVGSIFGNVIESIKK